MSPLSNAQDYKGDEIKRVGIIFSGGPAPAANSVISAAVISFLEDGREAIGFFHGYSNLQDYHPVTHRLLPDKHYRIFQQKDVRGIRNDRGIVIGTSRANPGKGISSVEDLADPAKTKKLQNVYQALIDLGIQALISIGGDDTLKTANFLHEFQLNLPTDAPRVRIVHLPKTIDNDYHGIDFTFGFFTAVDVMAKEVQNLTADAKATSSWFIVETMGRKAGWLAYGVAIAGEAQLVVSKEDLDERFMQEEEVVDYITGEKRMEQRLNLTKLADRIVDVMMTRERRQNQYHGVVVLAEGLAEVLSERFIAGIERDAHGHISLGRVDLGKMTADLVTKLYQERNESSRKVRGIQLGYESRCAPPHAFDVMLGSQLGIGAFRALVEEGLDAHMVSILGQLDLHYVPFGDLIDPESLLTQVRFIEANSDFHRLARFLETRADPVNGWSLGPRREVI